MQKLKVSTA